jgi:aryl-alcohol dehydrogenase-like predicted oxidoreductase
MQYTNLSTTDIKVSRACLWTMSFWAHVDEKTAFEIMDRAVDLWINFFDTAELYSVPPCKETYGLTEEIIWRWMKSRWNRDKIVLATKVVWPSRGHFDDYIREWKTRLNKENIKEALEWSLKRLWTDYIDLYQIHWPDRNVNKFWQRAWIPRPTEQMTEIEETIEALSDLIKEWKIKHYGLSNETPWWTMKFLEIAKEKWLPRPVSIQNNYNLLTRSFDHSLAEISVREYIWLLWYSPLWYWVLWWRYLDWNLPEWWRFTKYWEFVPRYFWEWIEEIIKKYKKLAEENWMTIASLAHAFAYSRKFMTSVIIWPSNIEQLEENVKAMDIKLSPDIFDELDRIQEERPNPCP